MKNTNPEQIHQKGKLLMNKRVKGCLFMTSYSQRLKNSRGSGPWDMHSRNEASQGRGKGKHLTIVSREGQKCRVD